VSAGTDLCDPGELLGAEPLQIRVVAGGRLALAPGVRIAAPFATPAALALAAAAERGVGAQVGLGLEVALERLEPGAGEGCEQRLEDRPPRGHSGVVGHR